MDSSRSIAIVDYGSGNLRSAEKALMRVSSELGTGDEIIVSADPACILRAGRIVLPGVGAFADCMEGLASIPGMIDALTESVLKRGTPFLGICVVMQLLASVGREFGDHAGLGWIDGEVVALAPRDASLKIPHMGWNDVHLVRPHPLLTGIAEGSDVYFVHSYEFKTRDAADILATADYGGAVTAAIARGNIAGVQFHPEKSQAVGLHFLRNFLAWRP
jgi:glutamine amidotransferase